MSETHLLDLLLRWEERRQNGEPIDLGELTRDRPDLLTELRRRIADLERVDDALRTTDCRTSPWSSAPAAAWRGNWPARRCRPRRPPFWSSGWPGRCTSPTRGVSSTATSSRPTC